jgi:hypothetical protein
MTTPTATAAPAPGTKALVLDRPPGRPRGLTWAVLRLHRAALILWLVTVAATAVLLVWMYALGDEARSILSNCLTTPAPGRTRSCPESGPVWDHTFYREGITLVTDALSLLMFPVAAWAGGALIGRELENGTARLAWTQSVTPVRWLTAKLGVPAAVLAAGTALAVLLNDWARQDSDSALVGHWYGSGVFIGSGPTSVAYALAGLAIGALAGLLTGRALAGAGTAVTACLIVYYTVDLNRTELWPAVTQTVHGTEDIKIPYESYLFDSYVRPGATGHLTYHPPTHYWPLQLMETGLLLAVTAAATCAGFALLRRRTR